MATQVTLPTLDTEHAPADQVDEMALLEEYSFFFSTGLHDFGIMKVTPQHLELE